ncbi:hypothetical protein NDU88_002046 [Pleurodeles waltl]|uniref:Uncharacterized protein n=1 Tax=Pleurodeles waltl TaxID=8319 RepID=A0AAV7LF02_PLEWA|nr:hypothetical protein NDU88_002046 [Pleurodeles waltl]
MFHRQSKPKSNKPGSRWQSLRGLLVSEGEGLEDLHHMASEDDVHPTLSCFEDGFLFLKGKDVCDDARRGVRVARCGQHAVCSV